MGQGRGERDQLRQSERKAQDQSYGKQKDQTVGQGRGERDQTRQSEQKAQQKQTPATAETTQQRRDQTGAATAGPNARPGTTTGTGARPSAPSQGQAQQGQSTTTGANTQGQTSVRAEGQGAAAQSMSGRVSVTSQQQTTLQQSVLGSRDVARVNFNSINFRVNTGVVVPRHVSFVSVAAFPVLIDTFPAYRDYSFFVVEDEIVFVDRSRRIVDVVPAGPRTRFTGRGRIGGGSVAALDLSPDEIRVVQRVLIQRGLLTGRADGVFSARTREALMVFQRRQGLQASGTIDTRTVAALGVSNKISATQNQSTTAGQQPSARQNVTGQNTGQANAPARQNEPTTTGQAGRNQPATTGQAGTQRPPAGQTTGQAPARGGNQPSANQPSGQTNQNNNAPAPAMKNQSDQGGSGRKY
ncbi:peptidoglycan-binding protein [Bradyrhizobium sp. CSA112]|uniref:peptidoglycan-binding protein n=1 Tax=Bradyrhizobium sp. CSA112 TaxID=2699170 RepID=UPI0023B15897|nr:peptidoglycan-binding protein [Bradyrhizobium sp. CSA112]